MKNSSVLIVGCGDLGIRAGTLLLQQGCLVTGVRRNTAKLPEGFVGHAADYTQPGSLDFACGSPDYSILHNKQYEKIPAVLPAGTFPEKL